MCIPPRRWWPRLETLCFQPVSLSKLIRFWRFKGKILHRLQRIHVSEFQAFSQQHPYLYYCIPPQALWFSLYWVSGDWRCILWRLWVWRDMDVKCNLTGVEAYKSRVGISSSFCFIRAWRPYMLATSGVGPYKLCKGPDYPSCKCKCHLFTISLRCRANLLDINTENMWKQHSDKRVFSSLKVWSNN